MSIIERHLFKTADARIAYEEKKLQKKPGATLEGKVVHLYEGDYDCLCMTLVNSDFFTLHINTVLLKWEETFGEKSKKIKELLKSKFFSRNEIIVDYFNREAFIVKPSTMRPDDLINTELEIISADPMLAYSADREKLTDYVKTIVLNKEL